MTAALPEQRPRLVTTRRGRGWLAVLAAVLVGVLSGCGGSSVEGGRTADGAQAGYISGDGSVATWEPDGRGQPVRLVGEDFAGNPIDTADWAGDVLVLNTWYAACPPCRKEAPDLVAIAADYADRGVRLLGVNGVDDAGAAQAFERTFEIPYPSIADTDGTAVAALQGRVPVEAVPTTVVLDRQGRVSGRILGLADPTILRGLIDDVLAETA